MYLVLPTQLIWYVKILQKNMENFSYLIEKVRTIVCFKRSVKSSDLLRKNKMKFKLLYDREVFKIAPLIGNIILTYINAPDMASATELEENKQVTTLLRPLEQTTRETSEQNYITLSNVIPMIQCLIAKYESFHPTGAVSIAVNLKSAILKELERRFGHSERCFLLKASTILDPRFKNIYFKDIVALFTTLRHLKYEMNLGEQDLYDSSSSNHFDETSDEEKFNLWAHHKNITYKKR